MGLDANYAADIEGGPAWAAVREYHEDGIAFWRRHGVHHPFLLSQYTGDGRRYHRSFSKIGFRPEHAHLVSFAELLRVPTVGRRRAHPGGFDLAHLERLRSWMFEGAPKNVFVTSDVLRLSRPTRVFPWLTAPVVAAGTAMTVGREVERLDGLPVPPLLELRQVPAADGRGGGGYPCFAAGPVSVTAQKICRGRRHEVAHSRGA